jgi:uncharacterized membrane protein YhiD involved in acid resistance
MRSRDRRQCGPITSWLIVLAAAVLWTYGVLIAAQWFGRHF